MYSELPIKKRDMFHDGFGDMYQTVGYFPFARQLLGKTSKMKSVVVEMVMKYSLLGDLYGGSSIWILKGRLKTHSLKGNSKNKIQL